MIDLLISCAVTSMQILFIHILFWDGMILAGVRYRYDKALERMELKEMNMIEVLDRHADAKFMSLWLWRRTVITLYIMSFYDSVLTFLRKPLFDCLICMTSIWGTVLYFLFHRELNYLEFLFTVGGISTIIYGIVGNANDYNGERFVKEKSE